MMISLEIEKSKLNREKSLLLLDKSLLMYFAFIIIGVVGFINKYIDISYLNYMIMLGFGVLLVGLVPYIMTMGKEEKRLNELLGACQKGAGNRAGHSKGAAKSR